MNLRQLEYAVAVAEHRSFTGAAAALRVAQPSLSQGVAALEAELGVELFARVGRRTQVTPAGEAVVDAARRVLQEAAEVVAVAGAVRGVVAGALDLVALPTLAVEPLVDLVAAFHREHPGVEVRVREPDEASGVEAHVRQGRAEVGLTDVTTGLHGLVRVPLFRQEVVAISPPGSTEDGALTPAALAALPLIATPPGTSSRRLLDQALARSGRPWRPVVEIAHREAIVPLVLAGVGTSLVPTSAATAAAEQGAVVRALQPALGRRIGLVHRPGRLSPAAVAFVAVARHSARRGAAPNLTRPGR